MIAHACCSDDHVIFYFRLLNIYKNLQEIDKI